MHGQKNIKLVEGCRITNVEPMVSANRNVKCSRI